MRMRLDLAGLLLLATLALARSAAAQGVERRYADEPTNGIALPTAPLAGEQDARAVSVNPGGLALLRGAEAAIAGDLEDSSVADSSGPGFGLFAAAPFGGALLPRMGFGMGLEWLRPARAVLDPDPGAPFRFTLAYAIGLGPNAGFGVSWHHFSDDGALGGLDTFDLGLSARAGNYFAFGAGLRDLNTGLVAGTPVQRRYQLELLTRPFGTSALEVAIGGQLGETRLDTDGWARAAWRVARGLTVHAELESRELHMLDTTAVGVADADGRDVRATLGVEISFGSLGLAAYGTGVRDSSGANHPLGGSFLARVSAVGSASVLGHPDHIERVELAGNLGVREVTALVLRLRAISRDASARALVVTFDGASSGWGGLQELRNEILAVKRTGKPVFAYMVSGTSRDYFVATAADKIYLDPAGGLRVVGIAGTTMFFRGAFDQLGVLPQFEKIGEFKSAPEQFTETGPTEIAQTMNNAMFDSIWEQWVGAVADGRHLSHERVKAIVDNGPFSAGDLAVDHELVDAVASPEKVSELITRELNAAYPVGEPPREQPDRWQHPGIAIIYVDGDIADGKSKSIPLIGQKVAGGETIAGAITAARLDPRVSGIVLRIDSPGGSALASELIAREVFATRGVKPIVCSMSNVAASGGYFVAAGCDAIYAEPMTITGSIGIFFGKFDLSGLAHKLGISIETYKRGARADVESMFRPYTDEERAVLLDKLRYMYGRFVGSVAEGRKMTKAEVDNVGRGHVYTGAQAKPERLVDAFGSVGTALDDVKHRLGLGDDDRVTIIELPNAPASVFGWVGSLLGASAGGAADASLSLTDLPAFHELLRGIPASLLVSPDGAQARLPYDLAWD